MAITKTTGYRIPDATKKKLAELAELDNISMTTVIINLINKEYRDRKEEIKEFRRTTKGEEN